MENNSSSLKFAGDISIKEVQLNSLNGQVADVTNQIISIEIYEDLFSPFMSISIVLRESLDYLNLFPFNGEEFIDLTLDTPSFNKPITGRFYVYKMTDRLYTKEREVVYTIKAISEEYYTDANTKISKAFSGNITESVALLLGKEGLNTKKKTNIEKTSNKNKMVSNFWSPTKCLNELATTAVSNTQSPSFLFFENREGFNFRSIDAMLSAKTYQTFTKDNYSRTKRDDGVDSIKDPEADYSKIIEIEIPTVSNYMEDVESGRLKSRIVSHDILTKKYKVKDYSIKKDKIEQTLLNPAPAYSKYSKSNAAGSQFIMPRHYGNFTNFSDTTNYSTVQRRMSFFQNLNKFRINIEVFGRTDYTVGQIYDITLPKVAQILKEDSITRDAMLSGRYIVSAISHTINKENHICKMELIKNSVLVDLNKA